MITDTGVMRTRLEVQQVSQTAHDTFGEPTPNTFAKVAERWARVDPISGRESLLAMQAGAELTHRVTMRADSLTRALTPKHRFKIKGTSRILDVMSLVNESERSETIIALCVERVS